MNRLLITGAAGGLGKMARERLQHLATTLRLSDRENLGDAADHEELVICDLADEIAVHDLVEGCDGIVHFGGISTENTFKNICASNLVGVYNLYEAARAHGQPRILFASSNHAIGFYRQDQHLRGHEPTKPDGLYGVSKVYGEAMASMYFHKFGQETAIVRIGSCFPEPKDHRMMSTWLSADDFVSMIEAIFSARLLGCPIIWGVSDNDEVWWDNSASRYLGWKAKDNAETFRETIEREHERPAPEDPRSFYQGGTFALDGIHKD